MRKLDKIFDLNIAFLLFLAFLLTLFPINSQPMPSLKINTLNTRLNMESVEFEPYDDLWEQAWVWVNPSGWINSRVEIQSRDLGFSDQSLNFFIASYSDIYNYFDHANWWFWPTDNPADRNAGMEVQFRTTNASLAREYANLIMEFVNKELGITYEYEGTYAWEDWRDPYWVDLTRVSYRTHIDFPWFVGYINDEVIPRDIGGLAETINVKESNHVSAWAWPRGDNFNPEIGFSFGFDFNKRIYEISGSFFGSHVLSVNDLIHVSQIQKSPYQDELWINCELPDVTLVTHSPALNDSNIQIMSNYHPPPENWVKHHYWDVNFQILGGVYTAITVSFIYDFIPWFLETQMTSNLIVNPYGYFFKGFFLQGEYTSLIDIESLTYWDPEIVLVELNFNPTMEALWDSFHLSVRYPDYNDHYDNANNFALDVANYFGIVFKEGNWTDSWWWGPNFNGISYNFNSDDFTIIMSQNLLTGSDVVQSTPAFVGQNISALTEYRQTTFYRSEIDGYINQMEFKWNPLSYEIQNPIKDYPGYQEYVNLDLLNEWGWLTYPFCSNYSRSEFRIVFPIENEDFSVYPNENNGWGWDIGTGKENWNNINFISHNLNIYTEPASLKFNNNTVFGDFGVFIDYHFHDDSDDLNYPGMHVYYRAENGTEYHSDWEIVSGFTFSGLDEHIKVNTWDDNDWGIHMWDWSFYFWNGTHHEPRFGYSGVKQVSARAYFADLPVRSEQFERELLVTQIWEENGGLRADYNVTWNTTDGFADGEWTLLFEVEDNIGNTAEGWALRSLVVDNYDDTLYTEGPNIEMLSAINTTVSGIHTAQVNVTDDVGLFAVVLTRDGTVWLLNDSNSDGILDFNWYTMGEMEGSTHFFTITAWDIDGHKTIYSYWLEIDNIPTGNAPTLVFISPNIENETITGMYTFRVNATDDHGISSVRMQIDTGAKYSMQYNPISGYYEYTHNVSKELNGYRTLNVTVKDIDENQHTINGTIHFFVIGGQEGPVESNSPEWDPTRSSLPENLSEYIDEGRYLEYIALKDEIMFQIAVKDDNGIAAVDFTIYAVDDFSEISNDIDLSEEAREVFSTSVPLKEKDNNWEIYEYLWDSTTVLDNYYFCEFDIQDIDTVANHLYIRVLIETDNYKDDPTLAGIPGFEIGIIVISITTWTLLTPVLKQYKYKKK